jgi:hypothetical protein
LAENPLPALSVDFVVTESRFSGVTNNGQVAAQDPTRWAILFSVPVTGQVANVSTRGTVTSAQGIRIDASSPPLWLNFRDVGALVQQAWFTTFLGTSGLTVIEVFYRPAGWEEAGPELMEELAERYRGAGL